jgi:hypothetical protein
MILCPSSVLRSPDDRLVAPLLANKGRIKVM